MDFIKRKKWSILGTVLLFIIIWVNYEQFTSFSHPESYHIGDFPHLKQPDGITCGPTSCAMLLQYYGQNVTIGDAAKNAKTEWFRYQGEAVGMTSPDFVERTLKDLGVPSKLQKSDISNLKYYVSQNRPPIVLVRSGLKTWHYVVVIGYDSENLILADPAWGKERIVALDIFEKAWSFTGDLRGNQFGTDHWKLALKASDVTGHTLIVPRRSHDQGNR